MATFEKRTSGGRTRYRAKIRLKGQKLEMTFDRLTDAREWAQDTEYKIKFGGVSSLQIREEHTLAEAIDRYRKDLEGTNKRRYDDIKLVLEGWKVRLGAKTLTELNRDDILAAREAIKKEPIKPRDGKSTRTNATVNRIMVVLRRVLSVATDEWEWLPRNPMAGIKLLPESKGRTRFLTDEERKNLLDACRISECRDLLAIVLLALTTGARRGEISKIRLQNVDLKARRILVPMTKNGKPKYLVLCKEVLPLITAITERAEREQVYLFASPHDITAPIIFERAWRTVLRRAKLKDFNFHDLRHTCASYMAMNGAGLHVIADVLGHSSLHVTKRYTHLLETQTAGFVESTAAKFLSDV